MMTVVPFRKASFSVVFPPDVSYRTIQPFGRLAAAKAFAHEVRLLAIVYL